ncbi:hypothetical protein D3C79_1026770 [compost metagenome]
MTDIIQDRIDLGNLQALPQRLNASKGANLNWSKYRDQDLDPQYRSELTMRQQLLEMKIAEQIRIFRNLNALGGSR